MEKNLEDECPICFEINGHNECVLLSCCDKYIHKDCIERWLSQNINKNEEDLEKNEDFKCLYCCNNNNFIDDFINKNKNHQIINIEGEIINNRFDQTNNENPVIKCLRVILILCSGFLIIVAIGTTLGFTLN